MNGLFENSLVAIIAAVAGATATVVVTTFINNFYFVYQRGFGEFPVKEWRVTNANDGTGLGSGGRLVSRAGKTVCQFETNYDGWVVWGPGNYCKEILKKGKYKAVFRIKVDHKPERNFPIIEISVSANTDGGTGTKTLAARILSSIDFRENDEYQNFSLCFDIFAEEHEFELRVYSKNNLCLVTLDYVQVSRRIL